MSHLGTTFCLAVALAAISGNSIGATITTEYTPTAGRSCVKISSNQETGDTVKRCPGVAGYSVLVLNSDDRASISIVTDDKRTMPLDFWDVVTPTFSTLGPRIEWLVESVGGKRNPVGIIVRIHTVDQADVAAPRPVSYLVVADVGNEKACVIGKIPAKQAEANQSARELAKARGAKCVPHIH